MIRDYSRRYLSVVHGKQKVKGRRPAGPQDTRKLTKLIGLIVTIAMLFGIAVSLWFGWLVRNGLDDLSQSQAKRQLLRTQNEKLLAQRDNLLSRDKIEAAAKKLGLYPPSAKQIRRP